MPWMHLGRHSASDRRYTFHHRLGVGGFGEVFRATLHTGTVEQPVAIKLLRPEFDDNHQATRRLRDEATYLAALRHPNIVRVVDLIRIDGRLALVTEFLEGENLYRVLRSEGRLPTRAALSMVARVADALHAVAHTRLPGTGRPMQMVHRDIKPGNVLLGREGEVTLLDFGIARADVFQRAAATAASTLLGSGAYTAPEVLMQLGATPPSDVWGLGATAFEAVVGQRLFHGLQLRDVLRLMARDDPAAFVQTRLSDCPMPAGARQLIGDMLTVRPDDRPLPGEIRDRADALANAMDDLTLEGWATQRSWPPHVPSHRSSLDGRTLPEEPLDETVHLDIVHPEFAPTERAVLTPLLSTPPPPPVPRRRRKRPSPEPPGVLVASSHVEDEPTVPDPARSATPEPAPRVARPPAPAPAPTPPPPPPAPRPSEAETLQPEPSPDDPGMPGLVATAGLFLAGAVAAALLVVVVAAVLVVVSYLL